MTKQTKHLALFGGAALASYLVSWFACFSWSNTKPVPVGTIVQFVPMGSAIPQIGRVIGWDGNVCGSARSYTLETPQGLQQVPAALVSAQIMPPAAYQPAPSSGGGGLALPWL